MKSKIKEIDIECGLESFFQQEKDTNCIVSRQVYFGGKKIDMVLILDEVVSSIEIKISDWRGALRQANLNRLACDYSYVAMWHKDAEKAIDHLEDFVRLKVGLIILDENSTPFILYTPKRETNSRLVDFSRNCLLASAVG